MIVVFWLNCSVPHAAAYPSTDLGLALEKCAELRKLAYITHVTISSENSDHVGKPGVDSIVDGKTPDGEAYDWSKAGRAGKVRRGDELKPSLGKRDGN